jgi:hypothetical protein
MANLSKEIILEGNKERAGKWLLILEKIAVRPLKVGCFGRMTRLVGLNAEERRRAIYLLGQRKAGFQTREVTLTEIRERKTHPFNKYLKKTQVVIIEPAQ